MIVIKARNVQQIVPEALRQLEFHGVERDSRNGRVRMFKEPVTSVYERPTERVIFWAERDANPFFHLYESLWMICGRNDVEPLAYYVARMRSFSDDGVTLHGAYGHRWRVHFGFDQLGTIINALKADPNDRRQVLSMWDANVDLGKQGKDFPCNLQAVFQINHEGKLDMTVTNRSNDVVWGAYGANAVHFSYLMEYVAAGVGVPVGTYRQVSCNLHAYLNTLEPVKHLAEEARDIYVPLDVHWATRDPYTAGTVEPFPLVKDFDLFNDEVRMFLDEPNAMGFREPFLRKVAQPMSLAYAAFKDKQDPQRFKKAYAHLDNVVATDWQKAMIEWVRRRERAEIRRLRAEDDGVFYDD